MHIIIAASYGTKTLRVAFTLHAPTQLGRPVRPGSFKSLMDDAACRIEALNAVGQQLRKRYDAQMSEQMPERLQLQLQRLAAAERARARRRTLPEV
jgi:hypothetical protein